MNLENNIKDVITKKLEEGIIEKVIAEQLEHGVKNAVNDLLGSYGDVTKTIKQQVKSVMIPYLESYDYSTYITKLDSVLVDVLKGSSLENKKLLENFKHLMIEEDSEKTIKLTDMFKRWMKYVENNVETDGLVICYDDEPTYENVEISVQVEYFDKKSWSDFEYAVLYFECEHDETMNYEIKLHNWKQLDGDTWTIDYNSAHSINSLRYLSEFDIYLMKLKQNNTKLILDTDYHSDEVEPDAKPEPSYY